MWHCLFPTCAGRMPIGALPASSFAHMALLCRPGPCGLPPALPLHCPALTALPPLQVPVLKPMDLMVEVSPRRVFANGHTYHINSISVNSDCETYMSADDLRINLWHLAITDRSFSILSCHSPAIVFHGQGGFQVGVVGLVVSELAWGGLCSVQLLW